MDPDNATLKSGLEEAERAKQAASGGGGGGLFGAQFMAKLATNPNTRAYMGQPDFLAMMREISADPSNLNKHLGDPRFQEALQVSALQGSMRLCHM